MNVMQHLSQLLVHLLEEDPRRVLLGEDILDGGMLGLSREALTHDELLPRLLPCPLNTGGVFAHAGGLALAGTLPIVLLNSASALLEGMTSLQELSAMTWRHGEQATTPVLFVAPSGPGFGLGGGSADSPENLLAQIPGLQVLSVGDAEEIPASFRSAAEFREGEQPTVLLLPRNLLLSELDEVPAELDRSVGSPKSWSPEEEAQVSVFAWGSCLELAHLASQQSDHAVNVIDVGRLSPLHEDFLVDEAQRTGRIIIAHPGSAGGIDATLASIFADKAILYLDAPIRRIGGLNRSTSHDEYQTLPSVEAITKAIEDSVYY